MPAARGCFRGLEARVVRCSSRGVAGESARALGFACQLPRPGGTSSVGRARTNSKSCADRGIGAAGWGRVLVMALTS
eukprot:2117048-Prymnesium_polylepis.1